MRSPKICEKKTSLGAAPQGCLPLVPEKNGVCIIRPYTSSLTVPISTWKLEIAYKYAIGVTIIDPIINATIYVFQGINSSSVARRMDDSSTKLTKNRVKNQLLGTSSYRAYDLLILSA
ncbi:hypothetical protein KL906_005018 [Ogataea polymorpha]|nr:hypothetical protein KL908_004779 [Ogataea polymorpha]KAG7895585.1 hypothetical protein KL936_000293 [Ogataea polymorpha]KAG7905948.1 hypothetical protein KL906_005018 [Ogataea polymorpha]KAG7940614.1 hypothetical protein KL904_000477 [Ogataea polymorpha]